MSSSGFPDWQRITQWFSSPVDEGTGVSVNPAAHVAGPFDLLSFASVIVCVKATGGPCTVTVKQSVPGGPASLIVSSSFIVAAGNVVFEGIVLEAGTVEVDFASAIGGATVDYAIVPSNVNTNVAGELLAQVGFQHNEAAIGNETAVSFDDSSSVTFAVVDDPANARVKVTAAAAVTSVFGRTGAVVASSGDYTAAQVTNAADKSSVVTQAFQGAITVSVGGGTGFGAGGGGVAGVYMDTGGRFQSTQTAGLNILASSRTTDANFRYSLRDDGTANYGLGGVNATDVTMARVGAAGAGTFVQTAGAGIGYGTGAGGAVTQLTSRATSVTLNTPTGRITTNSTSLAAGSTATFTVNNSLLTGTDVVIVNLTSGGVAGSVAYSVWNNNSGGFVISYTNNTGAALVVGITFDFCILKGAIA